MCKVTRNRFNCTKADPVHLLLDHTYVGSTCDDKEYAPANLNQFCMDALKFEKLFGYDCDLCLMDSIGKRREKIHEIYEERKKDLDEQFEKKKEDLARQGEKVKRRD